MAANLNINQQNQQQYTRPEEAAAPLFSLDPKGFSWATGIEDTFIPQTERAGERVLDEYALTNHYLYWREDLDRAAARGVNSMRYGIPWYKVEPQPDQFDWDWADQVLEYAAAKNIAIIVDLMHYGTPLWLDNQFLNHSYPERVASFAAEFAGRYRHLLSHYTPFNESLITMDFCGRRGVWPPYLRGEDGAVKILKTIARGIVLTVKAIRQADPKAVIVGVDAAGEYITDNSGLAREAEMRTARTFITTDLVTGRVTKDHLLADWLLENGMSENDLAWHVEHAVEIDVIGVNYYPEMSVFALKEFKGGVTSERVWAGAAGMERSVRTFAQRYGKPVTITETSTNGTIESRSQWLRDSLAAIPRLRQAGVPLVGYTWWPLFDLIDWVYRAGARPVEDYIARHDAPGLDPRVILNMIDLMGWNSLDNLPLESYMAQMGLYGLKMQFDGTFGRIHTPVVDEFTRAIGRGVSLVGPVSQAFVAASTVEP